MHAIMAFPSSLPVTSSQPRGWALAGGNPVSIAAVDTDDSDVH
jgi:hypothetical protein